jgi:hypothetical protein
MAPTNGAVYIASIIMKHVMSSAAEAKLNALSYVALDACSIPITLEELGHPQPPTANQKNNKCTKGIANNTVTQRRSRSMNLRFYWVYDRIEQVQYQVHCIPGKTNHVDYFTKHHHLATHQALCYTYLQGKSPIL